MESFKDKTMKEKKILPVGTKVFDALFGHGEVAETLFYDERTSRIRVLFKDGEEKAYNQDGKYSSHHKNPTLSLTEYTLEKGGFTPISEYWIRPKIGDWGYFWDREDTSLTFDELSYISNLGSFVGKLSLSWFRFFSHEIPEHIKQKMNNETDK